RCACLVAGRDAGRAAAPRAPAGSVRTHAESLARLEAPLPRGDRCAVARLALAAAPFGALARGPGETRAAHRRRATRLPGDSRRLPPGHLAVPPLADRRRAPTLPGAHAGNPGAGRGDQARGRAARPAR